MWGLFFFIKSLDNSTESTIFTIITNNKGKNIMEYNTCKTCGANNGRAGLLINDECVNCNETRKQKKLVLHYHLTRTDKELSKMTDMLNAL